MKRYKLINILLVLLLSFSVAPSFVIEENPQHTGIHVCAAELNHDSSLGCGHTHSYQCEFHNLYILSDNTIPLLRERTSLAPSFRLKLYTYYQAEKLIKPPIA
jgi:hypothetical protein